LSVASISVGAATAGTVVTCVQPRIALFKKSLSISYTASQLYNIRYVWITAFKILLDEISE
jgi:hypothetical protein